MMEKNFAVAAEYLVLPVRNAGEEGRLRLFVDDQMVLDYGVSFASGPEDVDWYAFFSLDRFRGREARVSASECHGEGASTWSGRPTPFQAPTASTGNACVRTVPLHVAELAG